MLEDGQSVLREVVSLSRGEVEPFVGFHVILRDSFAFAVTSTKAVLGFHMSLLGRLAITVQSFGDIFGYAIATLVTTAEIELGHCVVLVGGSPIPVHRFDRILFHA